MTLRGSIDIGEGVVFSVNPVWDTYHSDDCLVTSSQANMWLISPSTSEVSINRNVMGWLMR